MPVIFYSTVDKASSTIASVLKESFGFEEKGHVDLGERLLPVFVSGKVQLVELDCMLYATDFLRVFFKSDLFVFACRHSSESGTPCYTVHAPGNWGSETPLGGNESELQLTSARALDFLLQKLKEQSEMPVFREATHHGPTSLAVPTVFAELGSGEKEWVQTRLAEPVAKAIVDCCSSWKSVSKPVALGFGGTHYGSAFETLPFAFSHIASKHALEYIGDKIVEQAVSKTAEKVDCAFLDWKGCKKGQRAKLIAAFEASGLKWERV
ncbi:MAG: D-aminoacyl-tRNA deacylase [Candidatus Norongarragalinales archaeon]